MVWFFFLVIHVLWVGMNSFFLLRLSYFTWKMQLSKKKKLNVVRDDNTLTKMLQNSQNSTYFFRRMKIKTASSFVNVKIKKREKFYLLNLGGHVFVSLTEFFTLFPQCICMLSDKMRRLVMLVLLDKFEIQ